MDGEDNVVYAAGNSWIICRSKSYSGRIYYFNTLTGEAAWNLSDAEVEKAKQMTKKLSKQNKINIQECPEPKEPPMDQTEESTSPDKQQSSKSRVYNKQIINNKITKQTYPFPIMVPPYNVVANPMNPLLQFAVNSTTAYNPNVWAVPQTHQVFIGPSVTPLVNQNPSPPVNVAFNNQEPTISVQNTTSTLSGRFQNLRNIKFQGSPQRGRGRGRGCYQRPNFTPNRENNRFTQHNDQYQNNSKKNVGVQDLRKVLSAKRQRRASYHAECQTETALKAETKTDKWSGFYSENEGGDFDYEEERQNEKNGSNDADSDWLEENIRVEGGRLKLDISNLKKMRKPHMDPERWYIVADKDVLLNHLNLLNNLCSDDDCLLMVAQQVMAELREISRDESSSRTAARARRAVCFLQQQLDAGYVFIGDGTCGENDTRCDYLLNCCSNLYEQNYFVVLLSNDNGFKAYKNVTNVPIFNIKEIKQFLTKPMPEYQPDRQMCKMPEISKSDRLKPPPCLTKIQSKPIKITVTNDFAKQTDDKTNTCKISTGTQINSDVEMTEKCLETVSDETEHTSYVNNTVSPAKCTIDIAVQTDSQIEAKPTDNVFIQPQINQTESNEKTPVDERNLYNFMTPHVSKREIRLNRSVSTVTSVSSEDTNTAGIEKKQFKWRRKRHTSNTANDTKLSSATSSNADENSRDSPNVQKVDNVCEQRLPQNKDDSLSSEASSFLITRNLTNGTLTVEETSTSGVISNSTSNAESEIEAANITKFNKTDSQRSVMYEVTDKTMEDSLRTMNDEWVSRFIQIMEEVLTQILRRDEYFLKNIVYKLHGGGPWNIREAADCIKIKFCNNIDIIDAASKLTEVYMKLSDGNGRTTANLQPSEFMEMYSFGKCLIESMLSVLKCEDLEMAEQSLQRLLTDIQNPNIDASHNETFDNLQESEFTTNYQNDEQNATIVNGQSPIINQFPVEHITPIKQVVRRSARITLSNSPGNVSLGRVGDVNQSNTPAKSSQVTRSQEVTQSNSPKFVSLKTSDEAVQFKSPSQGRGSRTRSQEVNLSTSPEKSSLRRSEELIQSQLPRKGVNTRSQAASQSNSPGKISRLRKVEETIQSGSPSQGRITISLEVSQSNSPGQGSLRICEGVIESPGQDSLRRPEDVIESNSPGKGTYSLRTRKKSCFQNGAVVDCNNKKNDVKFIRKLGIEDSFFTSLNLVKKTGEINSQPTGQSSPLKPGAKEPVVTAVASSSEDLIRSIFDRNVDENSQGSKDISSTESKVIRKFTVFPEFEKKIEKPIERQPLDMDQLDYSGPFDNENNFMNEEYHSDDEEYYENEQEQNDAKNDYLDVDRRNISAEDMRPNNISEEDMHNNISEEEMQVIRAAPNVCFRIDDKFVCDSPLSMNNKLNFIFDTIVRRVRESLLNVQKYCMNTQKELSESKNHSIKIKYEMNENAERARDFLDSLTKSLHNIFYRETYEPERNIQSLLKDNGINDFDLNDNQLKDYRDVMGQCLEQAQVLQETLRLLITVIKKKPIE